MRLLPGAFLVLALVIVNGAAATPAPRAPIASWVYEQSHTSAEVSFLVVLRDQADLSPAARIPDKVAKGSFVRDALLAKAEATQRPLLQWLAARGIPHRPFYIVNAVLVTGTAELAEAIASRPEVERIDGNPTIHNLEPVTLTPAELEAAATTARAEAVEDIEVGVSNIRAPEVWAMGATGQGIVIGGADTGVQWDHPALKSHYRGWNGAVANHDYNWHDSVHSGGGACGPNSPFPCDDTDHGTHTMGTAVGADANNRNQIGVAPGAKFIGCRNMNEGNGTPAMYLECMEWFLAPYPIGGTTAQGDPSKAPDVTINSWGCPPDEGCGPATLQAAVQAQRAAGILFVAAAGNSGSNCSTVNEPPAIYDASYTVGAYNAYNGLFANFSSRGPVTIDGSNRRKPDITAPGVLVRSARTGNGYTSLSGTSMATPHVAGAVALLWSAIPTLKHKIDATEAMLNAAAVDVDTSGCGSSGVPNNLWGYGRLDVYAAVLSPVGVEPVAGGLNAPGLWLAPALPNPARGAALLRFRLPRAGETSLAIYASDGRRVRTLVRGALPAGEQSARWDGRDERGARAPAGLYFVSLRAGEERASGKLILLGD